MNSGLAAAWHREHRHGFFVIRQGTAEAQGLLEKLLPDPDELFRGATIFKPGTRTHGGGLQIEGVDCFLKRYNDRGTWYRLRHLFIASRAVRTYRTALAMRLAGVPVPEPLVCLEERRFGLLFRSYVLMRFTTGCRRLRDLWSVLGRVERETLMAKLAAVFAHMYRVGALHGDLKWDNIMVDPDDTGRVFLVDLDASRFPGHVDRTAAEKDLRRFLRDVEQYAGSDGSRRFMDNWQGNMRSG